MNDEPTAPLPPTEAVHAAPERAPAPTRDTAGVIAPPPLVYLAGLLVWLAIDRLGIGSGFDMPPSLRWTLAVSLGLVGALFVALALTRFRAANTPAPPWQPTTALVTSGIFGRTRNPMYLGFTQIYLALAFAFDAPVTLLLLLPVLIAMHYGVIRREERYMTGKFGAAYVDYAARVPRWM